MNLAAIPAETTRDDRLAIVLDAVLKQQAAGTPIDYDAVAQQHPDLVDEIKQLLAVGQMIDFVKSSPTKTTTLPLSDRPAAVNLLQLPCSFGDYELLAEVGRGGMGVVYKAWDKKLHRHVALKMILRGVHATAADLGRFQSEAQAAGGPLRIRTLWPILSGRRRRERAGVLLHETRRRQNARRGHVRQAAASSPGGPVPDRHGPRRPARP